jgi:hypothetical protein
MIKISISRLAATLAVSAALAGVGALPAAAGPDDGRTGPGARTGSLYSMQTKIAHCDDLTGSSSDATT